MIQISALLKGQRLRNRQFTRRFSELCRCAATKTVSSDAIGDMQKEGNLVPEHFWRKFWTFFRNEKYLDYLYLNKLGLSWAKLSPSWDWTVIKIYYIELIIKIEWAV